MSYSVIDGPVSFPSDSFKVLRHWYVKNLCIQLIFDWVVDKIKSVVFYCPSVYTYWTVVCSQVEGWSQPWFQCKVWCSKGSWRSSQETASGQGSRQTAQSVRKRRQWRPDFCFITGSMVWGIGLWCIPFFISMQCMFLVSSVFIVRWQRINSRSQSYLGL